MKRAVLSLAAAIVLAAVSPARADGDPADACAEAHRAAQKDRREHRLLAAREDLLACAREACPALIRRDCAEWLPQVEAETPTVVIDPRSRSGAGVAGARAFVDGAPFGGALDGKALPLDPGEHAVRIEAPGRAARDAHVVVREGEHAQQIALLLDDVPAPRSASPVRPGSDGRVARIPVAAAALGAAGVVALGLWAGFGLAGRGIKGDLDAAGCAPRCDPARVDAMWTDFTIADVSLAVSLASLAGAAIVYALGR